MDVDNWSDGHGLTVSTYDLHNVVINGPDAIIPYMKLIHSDKLKEGWLISNGTLSRIKDFIEMFSGTIEANKEVIPPIPVHSKEKAAVYYFTYEDLRLLVLLLLHPTEQELKSFDSKLNKESKLIELLTTDEITYFVSNATYYTISDVEITLKQLQMRKIMAEFLSFKYGPLQRGDIVKPFYMMYRNYDTYIYDGKTLIDMDYLIDDNGVLPRVFTCPRPYPIMYFRDLDTDNLVWPDFTLTYSYEQTPPKPSDKTVELIPEDRMYSALQTIYQNQVYRIYFISSKEMKLPPTLQQVLSNIQKESQLYRALTQTEIVAILPDTIEVPKDTIKLDDVCS